MPATACEGKGPRPMKPWRENIRLMTTLWAPARPLRPGGQFYAARLGRRRAPLLSRPISLHSYDPTDRHDPFPVRGQGARHLEAGGAAGRATT